MVDPTIIGGSVEVLSLALQLYLKLLNQSDMTDEEKQEFELREREKFLENEPSKLPKPPGAETDVPEEEIYVDLRRLSEA